MKEQPNERAARFIVANALNVRVTRYEDGRQPGQVDAIIHGRTRGPAALEIVGDHDPYFMKQQDALERFGHGLEIDALRNQWIAILTRRARVKDLVDLLPKVMPQIEAEWVASGRSSTDALLPDYLERRGVARIYRSGPRRPGRSALLFRAEAWASWIDANPIPNFVEEVLSRESDVPKKLLAHPAAERHAFLWSTLTTSISVQYALERRGETPIPTGDPRLPPGVTHVWVGGSFRGQGVVAWFPDRGWWRPAWQHPVHGPSVPDDFD